MPLSAPRRNRMIRLPFCQENYDAITGHAIDFRGFVDEMTEQYPELFPSFVLPYLAGFADDAEHALFLRKFSVPFRGLSFVLGKNPMHWHRIGQGVGRNSIVGTTVRNPEKLPRHLGADEKHTSIMGKKAYIATTVSEGCVLGASAAEDAGEKSLGEAYGVFGEEASDCIPGYSPSTVCTDGWKATRNALKKLFPSVSVILCFLHVFISIRDRTKKKFGDIYHDVASKLWECYHAPDKRSFSQRIRRLYEWAVRTSLPDILTEKIEKLRRDIEFYEKACDHPGSHRTSNMTDRLIQRMDLHLFSTQYFHGSSESAECGIRAWALIHNFAPSNPLTVKKYDGLRSPAERLSQFRYHDRWLQNLLISASLGGYRR